MAGILSRLEKKGRKGGSNPLDLLVRERTNPGVERTAIISVDSEMGTPDGFIGEASAENTPARFSLQSRSGSEVKIVQSEEGVAQAQKRKIDLFDESLPWWLTEPIETSKEVDSLVTLARAELKNSLQDDATLEQLNAAIEHAVTVAGNKLSGQIKPSGNDIRHARKEILSLFKGKGPLQSLYEDPAVTDIYLDGFNKIKCLRKGHVLETPFKFRSADEYESFVNYALKSAGRVLNTASPIVDCVLNDEWRSRINAVHASLRDGQEPALVIRVPRLNQISFYDLLRTKTLPASLAAWLGDLVACGECNILVIGPSGSGKTTLTSALLSSVGSEERVCTIEDVPEIFVPSAHVEKLVSRPESASGDDAVGIDQLLRATLRRAPHRIVVGEVRDKEGPLFLRALETGHAGSVATIHAGTPVDGLWRLLDVVAAYENSPQESIQRRISRSVNVLITLKRIQGKPCVIDVSEVLTPEELQFKVRTLVKFVGEVDGKRQWSICNLDSYWVRLLAQRGMQLLPGPGLSKQGD